MDPLFVRLLEVIPETDLQEFVNACDLLSDRSKNGEVGVTVLFRGGRALPPKVRVEGYVEGKR